MHPNDGRATPGGVFSAATQRAGAIFPSTALLVACVAMLRSAPSALPDEKMVSGRAHNHDVSRP